MREIEVDEIFIFYSNNKPKLMKIRQSSLNKDRYDLEEVN